MLENLNISPEILRGFSTGVLSAIISGLAVYLVESVKNRRLKRDNVRLVQEGEEVKSYYSKQLEELKKDHQLDLQKRNIDTKVKLSPTRIFLLRLMK
ncbi:hypothetical protein [Chryseobacterium foetidum]|uniref:hypothetical protein n=1 Tax=Chryseobacterium foetidum TaxID=2951057 RepID=UPI0021C7B843|nr:hypothetical protein [Chryseobacterium foetidum]